MRTPTGVDPELRHSHCFYLCQSAGTSCLLQLSLEVEGRWSKLGAALLSSDVCFRCSVFFLASHLIRGWGILPDRAVCYVCARVRVCVRLLLLLLYFLLEQQKHPPEAVIRSVCFPAADPPAAPYWLSLPAGDACHSNVHCAATWKQSSVSQSESSQPRAPTLPSFISLYSDLPWWKWCKKQLEAKVTDCWKVWIRTWR